MILRAGYVRKFIFGLPIDEGNFARRKFNCASPARRRLEQVAMNVIHHYNIAVEEGCSDNLSQHLGFVSNELCGFAHEGAAMGLFAIDALAPFSRGNFDRFTEGQGAKHLYMSFIGAGLAVGALKLSYRRVMRRYRHFSHPLIMDGYGFFQAYFRTERGVRRMHVPAKILANPSYRARYDAGVGRALWFVEGGDPDRLAKTILGFPAVRRADLWAGVGLACTYAGGVSREWILRLLELGKGFELDLAMGSLLACHARHRAENPAPHNDLAARLLSGLSSERLHELAEDKLQNIDEMSPTTGGQETWKVWTDMVRVGLANATGDLPAVKLRADAGYRI